ncbi:MAG: dephospho-CoA kinase [Rickettsiales bacterium]|nr:dephospho-CoA kinase [Rickettsiales bacterium]
MKIIALSGAIASGKNFIADILSKKLNAPIFDADKEVHEIYENNPNIIEKIKSLFPDSYKDGKIDRGHVSKLIFKNPQKLQALEAIIHPQVRKNYQLFLKQAKKDNAKFVILNVPLLLEKSGYDYDYLVAIIIYPSIQKRRFIARAKKRGQVDQKFLDKKFAEIKERQLDNKSRKEKANFVVNTSFSKDQTILQVNNIIKNL